MIGAIPAPPPPSPASVATSTGAKTLRLGVGVSPPGADGKLRLVRGGCWSRFFGEYEMPGEGALDVLEYVMSRLPATPRAVELHGAPAACLLPALWLRTIWLDNDATITIVWPEVGAPGEDPREQLAARLCCGLANHVACPDEPRAEELWGIRCGAQRPPGPAAFDHILAMLDLWDIRGGGGPGKFSFEWLARTRAAIERCADEGKTTVALYGAGTHTRALGPVLLEPRVRVACIIDDNPARHGQRLWGFPIVSQQEAKAMGVQAVILSANSFEDKLWAGSAPLREAGVEVIRLYTEGANS